MRNKIYTYLKSRDGGVSSNEIVEQVLKIKGSRPDICEKLIQTAVSGDRRFAIDDRRLWKVVEKENVSLAETEIVFLCFLSLETIKKTRTIVEISAQKLKDEKITDSLHLLVKPVLPVVPSIHLTADLIREMKDGISAEKAFLSLLRFAGESVLVGYDIHAVVNHLNVILGKSNECIENIPVCLKRLARKLVPDIRPKSLAEAASFFRIPLVDTRRTEKEISVIIEIFSRCRELLDEQGINTQEELLEFQYADADYIDFDRYSFDREFLKSIPQNPGVYIMKNANEEVVYVGKAKNLKTRVSSYFWNTPDRPQKTAELLNTVYSIDYEIVGSELAALLLEFKLIKQHQPKMNLQTEVHERTARYGSVRNFILIAPAVMENCLELFFVKEGLPVQRYEILKDAVNFSEVEKILSGRYYADTKIEGQPPLCSEDNNNIPQCNEITDIEAGERDIILSWVETNKDRVNYINVDLVSGREACLKLIKDYVKEKDTLYEKQYRWL